MIRATYIGYEVNPSVVVAPPHTVIRHVSRQADHISCAGNAGVTRDSCVVIKIAEDSVAGICASVIGQSWCNIPLIAVHIDNATKLAVVSGVLYRRKVTDSGCSGKRSRRFTCPATDVTTDIRTTKHQTRLVDISSTVVVTLRGIRSRVHPRRVGRCSGYRSTTSRQQCLCMGEGEIAEVDAQPDGDGIPLASTTLARCPDATVIVGWRGGGGVKNRAITIAKWAAESPANYDSGHRPVKWAAC